MEPNAHQKFGDRDIRHNVTPAALKLKDACAYLGGISQATLRRVINRGLIKPNRALRHILIPISELDRLRPDPYRFEEECHKESAERYRLSTGKTVLSHAD